MKKAFEVKHSNQPNCTFLLNDHALRRWLYGFNFIDDMDETHEVLLTTILLSDDVDELFDDIDSDDADVRAFVKAVRREREFFEERQKNYKKQGKVSFYDLPNLLSKGTAITVGMEPGVRQGAVVTEVGVGRSFFGPYFVLEYRFVVHNGRKFVYCTDRMHFGYFADAVEVKSLGVELMSDAAREQLIERGRLYRDLSDKPVHMAYDGTLVRSSWFGGHHFRAAGRVMVDVNSMLRLDPNYGGYHGDINDRDDDDDEVADVNDPMTLACASPYVYGYSFVAKAWGQMRVDGMSRIRYRKDAFDRLVLDANRKRVIRALVEADHTAFKDIVDNKGGGCIICLNGYPGVGKTATAEATAEVLERPLYMVSAGELGTEPEAVERSLRDILDMATSWNAIVLIDECDIFMEKRTKEDIKRNALVSIFLRMLEYYEGVMFLTTNRVEEIDPAFVSRIAIGLHYDKFKAAEREQVFRNLSAGYGFEDVDFAELAKKFELNGREIKHALRMALALARHEGRTPSQHDIEEIIAMGEGFRHSLDGQDAERTEPPLVA